MSDPVPDHAGDGAGPMADDPCAAALTRLWTYLDHELTERDEGELREHLAECPPCLAEYSIDVVLKQLVRRSCQEAAPTALRLRIHERLLQVTITRPLD